MKKASYRHGDQDNAEKHALHRDSSSSASSSTAPGEQKLHAYYENTTQDHTSDGHQHVEENGGEGGRSAAMLRQRSSLSSFDQEESSSDSDSPKAAAAAAAAARQTEDSSSSSSSLDPSDDDDYKDDEESANDVSWDMSSVDDDSDEILYKQDGAASDELDSMDGIPTKKTNETTVQLPDDEFLLANGRSYPKEEEETRRFEYEDSYGDLLYEEDDNMKNSKHSTTTTSSSGQGKPMENHTNEIFRQNQDDFQSFPSLGAPAAETSRTASAITGQCAKIAPKDDDSPRDDDDARTAALVPTTSTAQPKVQQDHQASHDFGGVVTSPSSSTDVPSACDAAAAGFNFAMEHRIFLKAALELLSQRDKYSGTMVQVDMNDPNTIKSGPLKKASTHKALMSKFWKVKYVEIRRGMFSYYEDAVSKDAAHEGELLRKNIPLQANSCTCRAVKVQHKALTALPGGAGAIFELTVAGRPKKLWMANSREERQAWINAIQDAMVGRSVTRGESQIDHHKGKRAGGISHRSPYKKDLERYLKLQALIRRSTSKESYVGGLSEIVGEKLNVPVQWMIEHAESSNENAKAFHEEATSVGVDQLWKDLVRDSVRINGELFKGDCGHAPERIIGALTRSILLFDRSSDQNVKTTGSNKLRIIESQAVSYARDVLLAGNRTRTGGDSYYCVDALCKNSDLVVLCPSTREAEPLTITVEHIQSEQGKRGSITHSMNDKSGWLKTRSRGPQKKWKKRYFVLSEGTLSYYEKALPRPHGLRGQLILSNATMQISEEKGQSKENGKPKRLIVSISTKDMTKDRQICFEDQNKFFLWAHALESAGGRTGEGKGPFLSKFRKMCSRDDLGGSPTEQVNEDQKGLKDHAASLGLDDEALASRVAQHRAKNGRARSTVKISVQASTEYKICTTDPQGDDKEDTWAWIRADFLQDFRVSGGPNGRITRGEEIVQVSVLDCHSGPSASVAPPRRRRRSLTRRLS